MHPGFDDLGDLLASRLADRLDGLPTLAKYDFALTFALHVNSLLNTYVGCPQLLPDLGFDRRVIRQFLVEALEQFFTRDFRRELADGRVRHLVARIEPRARRKVLRQPGFEIRDAVAGQ